MDLCLKIYDEGKFNMDFKMTYSLALVFPSYIFAILSYYWKNELVIGQIICIYTICAFDIFDFQNDRLKLDGEMKLFLFEELFTTLMMLLICILIYSPYKGLKVLLVISSCIILKFATFVWGQDSEVNYAHFYENPMILVNMIFSIIFASYSF